MENQNNTLVIERVFAAPVEQVWKYWSDPELYKQWWGPKQFTCPAVEMDFRVGGKVLGCMRGAPAEGVPAQDFWSIGTYKEIIPLKKIVVTDSFADEKGNVVPSTHYGMEGMPLEMLVTIEFEEQDGKTKMTLTHSGLGDIPEQIKKDMDQGWNESFDKIVDHLK